MEYPIYLVNILDVYLMYSQRSSLMLYIYVNKKRILLLWISIHPIILLHMVLNISQRATSTRKRKHLIWGKRKESAYLQEQNE